MKIRTLFAATVLTAGLSVGTLQAQHDDHQAPAPSADQAKGKMGMGMMGQMADHMSEMMGGHRQVVDLVAKISQSFAAMQAEKDPAALAKKMAEHGALLKELETKVQAHSAMMEKMDKMEKGDAAATPATPAAPAAPAPAHQH